MERGGCSTSTSRSPRPARMGLDREARNGLVSRQCLGKIGCSMRSKGPTRGGSWTMRYGGREGVRKRSGFRRASSKSFHRRLVLWETFGEHNTDGVRPDRIAACDLATKLGFHNNPYEVDRSTVSVFRRNIAKLERILANDDMPFLRYVKAQPESLPWQHDTPYSGILPTLNFLRDLSGSNLYSVQQFRTRYEHLRWESTRPFQKCSRRSAYRQGLVQETTCSVPLRQRQSFARTFASKASGRRGCRERSCPGH